MPYFERLGSSRNLQAAAGDAVTDSRFSTAQEVQRLLLPTGL
jgi:hypothetical protein